MNKIVLVDNEITINVDDSIEVETLDRFIDVKKIIIKLLKNTSLEMEYTSKTSKLDIEIVVKENVSCHIFEIRHDEKLKAQYRYILDTNSYLNITKFYDTKETRELGVVELNGVQAKIDYQLKTIATEKQKYDLMVYHNEKNTVSNIKNHGVNIKDGSIIFNVTGIVYNGIKDCTLDQDNKIVTFNQNKCTIDPKLLIEEQDVVANHSALIGKFDDDELFYLQSRGIDRTEAIILLTKGFLLENLSDERLDHIIEKYWR